MASNNAIDLDQYERAVSTLLSKNDNVVEDRYQPRTLKAHNQLRTIFLPFYPKLDCYMPDWLLLASVPRMYSTFSFYSICEHMYRKPTFNT